MAEETNVEGDPIDDRAPLLSFPPKNDSVKSIINAEGDTGQRETEVGGSR